MSDLAGSVYTKRTLGSIPGNQYDSLYYNSESSRVEMIENVCTVGKYMVSLNAPSYGGSSNVTFPNINFLGPVILHFELPIPDFTANPKATLCQMWGLALINSVELLIGNSNIGSQRIDRTAMFHSFYSSVQTADELLYDMNAGGYFINSTVKAQSGDSIAVGGVYCADIILDLPWSNYCQGHDGKLYFDTSMLTSPITLQITLNNANSIWGGTYTPPSNNFTAQLFYRQIELTNRAQSLRNTLFATKESVISYPSVYRQSYLTQFTIPPDEFTQVSLNLQSFLNADLLTICLSAHLATDLLNTGVNNPVNPFSPLEIYDIQLLFGGDTVYNAPKYSYKLINQESNVGAVYLTNTYSQYDGSAIRTGTKQSHVLQINMSRLSQMCNQGQYSSFFNTIRLPKQVLQLNFKMKTTQYWSEGSTLRSLDISGAPATLLTTYFYPQITEINSSGSVNIFYN